MGATKRESKSKERNDTNVIRLSHLLHELIEENMRQLGWDKAYPYNNKTYDDIEKLHRIDGASYELIEKVIRWSQQDDFWQTNILSGAKLRKHFPRLLFGMNQEEKRNRAEVEVPRFI